MLQQGFLRTKKQVVNTFFCTKVTLLCLCTQTHLRWDS